MRVKAVALFGPSMSSDSSLTLETQMLTTLGFICETHVARPHCRTKRFMSDESWQEPPILFLPATIARLCDGDAPPGAGSRS